MIRKYTQNIPVANVVVACVVGADDVDGVIMDTCVNEVFGAAFVTRWHPLVSANHINTSSAYKLVSSYIKNS
ncbi:hypothetical protein CHS0354_042421 [Potamilus streckersoni]|uniref:Uncharacterized protein n=1 Tax=Potamilus streckersoni TaxID=2493646 RepID=A0AAE0W2N1_9BIVA|nr:hypothetical protein CHS0354_042421 [Potamilus streckersoni]